MGRKNTLVYPIVSDPPSPREKVQESKSTLNISSIQIEDPRSLNGPPKQARQSVDGVSRSGEALTVGLRRSVVYLRQKGANSIDN